MPSRKFCWSTLFAIAGVMLAGCGSGNSPSSLPMTSQPLESNAGNKYATLYAFKGGTDAANPYAGLLLMNGEFYGTTYWGGDASGPSGGNGAVFKISATGDESILYRFQGGTDGAISESGLTAGNGGVLFGATDYGGGSSACPSGCGTVFELAPSGSGYAEHFVYAFRGGKDGAVPIGTPVLGANGTLYGTTIYGGGAACTSGSGVGGCGTVFKLTPSGSGFKEKVVYRFQGGTDGASPTARLTAIGNGSFDGTTEAGGSGACPSGCGTVFNVTTSGAENVLYRFNGGSADGARPRAALLSAGGGKFYGLTLQGGASNGGTLYALSTKGKHVSEQILHSFPSASDDGFSPDDESGLISENGVLYGTTASGGAGKCACGVVFAFTPSSTPTEKVLYTFKGVRGDGGKPRGSLTSAANGKLYGTAFIGGSKGCSSPSGTRGCGTVFTLSP